MALVTPLLLMLLFGLVEYGFLFQRYVVLTNAAMEGARVASLPGYTDADAIARVQSYAANGGLLGSVSTIVTPVTIPGASGGTWPAVQVTVTHIYTYQFVGGLIGLVGGSLDDSVTLAARSTMRLQVGGTP
jgi:Flp pilus assembly protein TadG